MFTACWSVKGGSGTTVVAASLALAARRAGAEVVLADLAGDVAAALGSVEPSGPGVADWLAAGEGVPNDALARIVSLAGDGLRLVHRGEGALDGKPADGRRLVDALTQLAAGSDLVADCGRARSEVARAVVGSADRSLLVLRPCYLALRRAAAAPRPHAVVLITEPERSLSADDVEDVLGVPVAAAVPWDPGVARAVDAGLLSARIPRRFMHALRAVPA